MDHQLIETDNLIERYVAGKMSEFERAHFEDHFITCEECLGELEAAQQIRTGLEHEAQPMLVGANNSALGVTRWRLLAVAATLLLVVSLPLLVMLWMRSQGAAAQLVRLGQPHGNVPIYYLETLRGDASDARVLLMTARQSGVLLVVDLPPGPDSWTVEIANGEGDITWEGTLSRNSDNSQGVFLPRASALPGEYTLSLRSVSAEPGQTALSFRFRIDHEVGGEP